ncbi:MAG: hypothetical protein DME99_11855 [Verrucomicrobia bacterium]|nr:MAG: hypothetical protein DME99_11855 [Verrucomicrobiota bacterium]
MAILLHLISNWQMNPSLRRTLLAAFLLSAACIFAVTAARVVEPQVNDVAAAKPGTVFRECRDCPEMVVRDGGYPGGFVHHRLGGGGENLGGNSRFECCIGC